MYERIAKEITSKFGIENPESTIGYKLILDALNKAYENGIRDENGRITNIIITETAKSRLK